MKIMSCIAAFGLVVALAACGGEKEAGGEECQPRDDETTGEFLERCDPEAAVPSPSAEEGDQLVAELDAIVPGLAAQREDAIDSARNLCSSIVGGGQNLEQNAALRFSTGDLEVTDSQGAQIVELVRSQPWCA
ncbi:hypothetical protein D9V41_09060 [Aeromicrobium phragmitis]|uniref:DUF732 domain-containing protein n=1 Tax=Aeromicrobium phragmitis TaxID=2478914 RepID=A0A3L8PKZ6_9ACTN|nr:hypothetical protein [Aeromicrobium phragmitis]RLV56027.1 hypothetical protein D9V41_09060 [Aeromicrobium phragmitis]